MPRRAEGDSYKAMQNTALSELILSPEDCVQRARVPVPSLVLAVICKVEKSGHWPQDTEKRSFTPIFP